MYEFWYDYEKPKYREKEKLCSMDTDTFTVYIKIDDIQKTLQKMLKLVLALQITNQIDHYQKENIKKSLDE